MNRSFLNVCAFFRGESRYIYCKHNIFEAVVVLQLLHTLLQYIVQKHGYRLYQISYVSRHLSSTESAIGSYVAY